jgi:hypothetical protein
MRMIGILEISEWTCPSPEGLILGDESGSYGPELKADPSTRVTTTSPPSSLALRDLGTHLTSAAYRRTVSPALSILS